MLEIFYWSKDFKKKKIGTFNLKFSSMNFAPYILSPPLPSPNVKSPPYIMKFGIILWKLDPL